MEKGTFRSPLTTVANFTFYLIKNYSFKWRFLIKFIYSFMALRIHIEYE